MKWSQIPLGIMQTNCYIVENGKGDCIIFDPGSEGKRMIRWLIKKELTPCAIFLTHAHFDHIGAVDEIRDHYQIPVYLHENEENWLSDPAYNGSKFFTSKNPMTVNPPDILLSKEMEQNVGDFTFSILETPGHSPGSVSYYFVNEGFIISGDVLFKGSIGRTDLKKGNQAELMRSIHDKLLTLPEETLVLPGHGPTTTIIEEMDSNPFLNGF
ncbi:MAG: MBL fold metallo-hydrolase [Bacillota bacterium]|nr:MBL fold metallo-hydrolase [Bacillota bacterium]